LLRLELFIIFVSQTIAFGVVVYRDEFSSKNIKGKSLSLVKKIAPNDIPDIGVGKGVKNCMDNKYII